ncbi:MAG: hypothetical protein VB934_02210 [Polyangiaceae bacterium]
MVDTRYLLWGFLCLFLAAACSANPGSDLTISDDDSGQGGSADGAGGAANSSAAGGGDGGTASSAQMASSSISSSALTSSVSGSSSGGGGGGNSCAHSPCTPGDALKPTCHVCVSNVCSTEPSCCVSSWNSGVCVALASNFCNDCASCGGSDNTC